MSEPDYTARTARKKQRIKIARSLLEAAVIIGAAILGRQELTKTPSSAPAKPNLKKAVVRYEPNLAAEPNDLRLVSCSCGMAEPKLVVEPNEVYDVNDVLDTEYEEPNSVPEPNTPVEPNKPVSPTSLSQEGIDFIKGTEDFSPVPYLDYKGYSIGYGHLIEAGETYTTITRAEGEEIFKKDLRENEEAVNKYVVVPLTQGQYDVLCSFVHNFGGDSLRDSTLLKKLNKKDYQGAADQLPRWVHVTEDGVKRVKKGLVTRRHNERKRFLSN